MARAKYKGMTITKETVAVGVGGQFIRDPDDFPEPDPKGRVHADVWFTFDNDKHKFLADGTVEHTLILTMDVSTFTVLGIEAPPPEPEQQVIEGTDDDGAE